MSHIVNQNFLHIRNTRACALENPMFGSMTSGIFTTAERGQGGGRQDTRYLHFLATRQKRGEAGWNRGGAFAERQRNAATLERKSRGFSQCGTLSRRVGSIRNRGRSFRRLECRC